MGVWQFFQNEILGMKWLNRSIGKGLSLLGLDMDGRLGGSVQFFLYDVIKITILLCFCQQSLRYRNCTKDIRIHGNTHQGCQNHTKRIMTAQYRLNPALRNPVVDHCANSHTY